MKVDRSDPFVWGGRVIEEEGTMGGREVADPSDGPTEFCREVPLPPGVEEETSVYLGELRANTEEPVRGTATITGRVWGRASALIGGEQ